MKRKLLILAALLGLLIPTISRPAHAVACTTQTYCNVLCPTGTGQCCCPGGTAAAGQVANCRAYNLGVCDDPCWGLPPGCIH